MTIDLLFKFHFMLYRINQICYYTNRKIQIMLVKKKMVYSNIYIFSLDKTNQANQIHKESTTSGNLFNLNAEKLNPVHQISPNVQENHNLKNPQESLIKLNLPNIQNVVTDNESSKLENLMDKPNLRNFPDPRPFTAVLTTMSKPTQSNFQKVILA